MSARLRHGIAGGIDLSGRHTQEGSDDSWLNTVIRSFPAEHPLVGTNYAISSNSASVVEPFLCEGALAISADAEIHNRSELLHRLGDETLSSTCSDARLILKAYGKWGQQCPDFLLGEFSFSIWDESKQQVFCCRDHLGQRPFYYWTDGSRFAFSGDPLWLCSLPGVGRTLNRAKLAAWAYVGTANSHPEETFYSGILSLPSATSLTFGQGSLRKRTYWNPEQAAVSLPSREEDCFDAFREILFEAVECRTRGKTRVAAFLSGGLDSSALVSVAARCLERSNREIAALAAVLPEESKPQFQDEREYIDEFRTWPNVTIEYVAPRTGGPFDGIEDPSNFCSSQLRNSRQYLDDAIYDAALRRGSDVVLAGNGGEAGPTAHANGYYLELAADLKWYTLAKELSRARAVRRTSAARLLGREIRDLLSLNRLFEPSVLFAPDFIRTTSESTFRKIDWPDHRREQLDLIGVLMRAQGLRRGSPGKYVPITLPFLDKRILEFCLAAPGHLKVHNGYSRYLIREALDGILPKKIQWRTTKCAFAPDYPARYMAQLGKARDFVAGIGRKDPVRSIIDVDRLLHLISQPDMPPAKVTALIVVPTTIYMICFLRQFAEFRP